MQNLEKNRALTVLVIDDDIPTGIWLSKQINVYGHKTWNVTSALEALTLSKQISFDVVFTDCRMIGMSGFELVNILRRQITFKNTLIIGMTASTHSLDFQRGIAEGMDICLTKPLTKEKLSRFFSKGSGPQNTDSKSIGMWGNVSIPQPHVVVQREFLLAVQAHNFSDIVALECAIATQSHREIAHIAHKVKGIASIMGYVDVAQTAANLEAVSLYVLSHSIKNKVRRHTIIQSKHPTKGKLTQQNKSSWHICTALYKSLDISEHKRDLVWQNQTLETALPAISQAKEIKYVQQKNDKESISVSANIKRKQLKRQTSNNERESTLPSTYRLRQCIIKMRLSLIAFNQRIAKQLRDI